MKRNNQSKYRVKLIQEHWLNKAEQKQIDSDYRTCYHDYRKMYKSIYRTGLALNTVTKVSFNTSANIVRAFGKAVSGAFKNISVKG